MNDSPRSNAPLSQTPHLAPLGSKAFLGRLLLLFVLQNTAFALSPKTLLAQDNTNSTAPLQDLADVCATDLAVAYQQQTQRIAAQIAPSLVQIEIVGTTRQGPATQAQKITGVLIDNDGYLLTEASLFVERPDTILVNTHQGQQQIANVVAIDFLRQLALLKTAPIQQTSLICLAESSQVQVGQGVLAFGKSISPNAVHISKGIVSATDRIWGKAIQTDAKIGPLNYGGPLVDIQGRMLGILCPLSMNVDSMDEGKQWYDSGIGFAVSVNNYEDSIEHMKAGNDIFPGQTGIDFKQSNLNSSDFQVSGIHPGSPADLAGLKTGDQIVKVNQNQVNCLADYYHATRSLDSRQAITLEVRNSFNPNNEKDREVLLQLVSKLVPYRFPYLGFTTKISPQKQVEVDVVLPDGPSADKLQPADRLVAINQIEIDSIADLNAHISKSTIGQSTWLTLQRDTPKETLTLKIQTAGLEIWLPTRALLEKLSPKVADTQRRQETVTSPGLSVDANLSYVSQVEPSQKPRPLIILQADSLLKWDLTLASWKSTANKFGLDLLVLSPQTKIWAEDDFDCGLELIAAARNQFNVGQGTIAVVAQGNGGQVGTELSLTANLICHGLVLIQANPSRSLLQFKNSPSLRKFFLSVNQDEPNWVPLLRERFVPTAWLQTAGEDTAWSDPTTLDIIAGWVCGLRLQ